MGAANPSTGLSLVALSSEFHGKGSCLELPSVTSVPVLGVDTLFGPDTSPSPCLLASQTMPGCPARRRLKKSSSLPSLDATRSSVNISGCSQASRSSGTLSSSSVSCCRRHSVPFCRADVSGEKSFCRTRPRRVVPSSAGTGENARPSSPRSTVAEVGRTAEDVPTPDHGRFPGLQDLPGFVSSKEVFDSGFGVNSLSGEPERSPGVPQGKSPISHGSGQTKGGATESESPMRGNQEALESGELLESGAGVRGVNPVGAFSDFPSKGTEDAPRREVGMCLPHFGAAASERNDKPGEHVDVGPAQIRGLENHVSRSAHDRCVSTVFRQSFTGRLMARELQQMLAEASQEARAECALLQQRLQQIEAENAWRAAAAFEAVRGPTPSGGCRWQWGVNPVVRQARGPAVNRSKGSPGGGLSDVFSFDSAPAASRRQSRNEPAGFPLSDASDKALEPSMSSESAEPCGNIVSREHTKRMRGLHSDVHSYTASTPPRVTKTAYCDARSPRCRLGSILCGPVRGRGPGGSDRVAGSRSSTPSLRSLDAENPCSFYLSPPGPLRTPPKSDGGDGCVSPLVATLVSSSSSSDPMGRTGTTFCRNRDSAPLSSQVSLLCQLSRSFSRRRTLSPSPLRASSSPVSRLPHLLERRRARSCCCSSCEGREEAGAADKAGVPRSVEQAVGGLPQRLTQAKQLHQAGGGRRPQPTGADSAGVSNRETRAHRGVASGFLLAALFTSFRQQERPAGRCGFSTFSPGSSVA